MSGHRAAAWLCASTRGKSTSTSNARLKKLVKKFKATAATISAISASLNPADADRLDVAFADSAAAIDDGLSEREGGKGAGIGRFKVASAVDLRLIEPDHLAEGRVGREAIGAGVALGGQERDLLADLGGELGRAEVRR